MDSKRKLPDKVVVKDLSKKKKDNDNQRYVRVDRVEEMKKKGWKKVGDGKDAKGKILDVKTQISDLVLMTK